MEFVVTSVCTVQRVTMENYEATSSRIWATQFVHKGSRVWDVQSVWNLLRLAVK